MEDGAEKERDGNEGKKEKGENEWDRKAAVQGYGMFSGSSLDVCGGPALRRGGVARGTVLMVGGLWRGEPSGEEVEPGPLWQGAISHLLTQAH